MAINLITGQPRNGKTQRVMPILHEIQERNDKAERDGKPRAKVYTDIEGINAPDTPIHFLDCITTLSADEKETIWFGTHDDPAKPDNFWCPDYGSYFFFDECHKLEFVKDTHGSISKNPSTVSLNEHGHAGHTIYLITQFPQYVHTHIRGLVAEHWHVKRKMGMRFARVYKFDEFKLNPRTEATLKDAHSIETFKFKKKWEQSYKSASAHEPRKIVIPKILLIPIIALIFLGGVVYYYGRDSVILRDDEVAEQTEEVGALKEQTQQQLQAINELRFELEELKREYLPKHIAVLAEHEEVRPAMVVSNDSACVAYNSYGEPLNISDSLCYQMNESPALIPRSRQKTAPASAPKNDNPGLSASVPPPTPSNAAVNSEGLHNIQNYESPRPYS